MGLPLVPDEFARVTDRIVALAKEHLAKSLNDGHIVTCILEAVVNFTEDGTLQRTIVILQSL